MMDAPQPWCSPICLCNLSHCTLLRRSNRVANEFVGATADHGEEPKGQATLEIGLPVDARSVHLLGESASGLIECCVMLRVVRNQVFGAKQQEALGANLFKL